MDEAYGIDMDGPIPTSEEGVQIPPSTLQFSETNLAHLKQLTQIVLPTTTE